VYLFRPGRQLIHGCRINGISGMTCTVCTKFDKTGTFITGCKNYKKDSINQHEKSESYKVNVIKINGQKNPQNSEGAKSSKSPKPTNSKQNPPFHIGPWTDISRASGILKGPVDCSIIVKQNILG